MDAYTTIPLIDTPVVLAAYGSTARIMCLT